MKLAPFLATAIVMFAQGARSAPLEETFVIKAGFLTGNSYRELQDAGKSGYVMGFTDGLFVSVLHGAKKSKLRPIEQCVAGMSDGQVVAILEKWLNDHPEQWHEQMNILANAAIREACHR